LVEKEQKKSAHFASLFDCKSIFTTVFAGKGLIPLSELYFILLAMKIQLDWKIEKKNYFDYLSKT